MKRLPLLKASKLDLAAACLYPWTSGEPWADSDSPAARYGRAVHELIESEALDLPVEESDYAAFTAAHELTAAQLRKLPADVRAAADLLASETCDVRMSEFLIALEPASGSVRSLEDREDRRGLEVLLIVDIIQRTGDSWVVRDWKTGRRPLTRRVEDSMQVRAYAFGVARLYDVEQLDGELAWIESGEVYVERARFDMFDLDAIGAQLATLEARRKRGDAVPQPGLHCVTEYCPIRGRCPAAKEAAALVARAAAIDVGIPSDATEIAGEDHARQLLEALPLVEGRVDQARKALRDWTSKNGAVQLAPGVAWGPVEVRGKESVRVTDDTRAILIEHLGEHAEGIVEAKETVTIAAIKRAAKALAMDRTRDGSRTTRKAIHEPLMDALRKARVATRGGSHTEWKQFKRNDG